MKEAPEGIVAYSWSGSIPLTTKFIATPALTKVGGNIVPVEVNIFNEKQLATKINNSGIIQLDNSIYIDFSDKFGNKYKDTEKLVLSKNLVETIDLISEGEVGGPVSGEYINSGVFGQTGWSVSIFSGYAVPTGFEQSRWLRSIYWNEVPILSDKAQFNFQSVESSYSVGLPNGSQLESLILEETSSRAIGERLRAGVENQKIYRILNKDCKGVILNIKIPTLSSTDATDGSISRVRIDWQISYRPIFNNINKQSDFAQPFQETIFGKIVAAGGYVRSSRVDFNTTSFFSKQTLIDNINIPITETVTTETPSLINNFLDDDDFIGWEVKIVRLSDDTVSSLVQNATYVDSITELYGSLLTYPNSAIVRSLFNAEFFSSIPDRAFEFNLLKVKIPGNYNPITRTYETSGFATTNGYWDGTLTTGKYWSNNPAWCLYDLLTNRRYGLGRYIDDLNVDVFTLYKIGQYCDELVSDNEGGLEPRFTCNTWIGGREDAYKVTNDLASVFRGITYYAFGNLYSVQDSKKDPRILFTNANVENGDFSYSSTSKKTRQSIAIVRYNNPKDFYKPAIEYVEDINAIRKYGVRELDMTAFACTSRGQAIRLGRWALLTNNIETETIQFNAGLEATALRPGDIFKISDSNRKSKRYGGRIFSIADSGSGAAITLDSKYELYSGIQYNLSVLTPSYYYENTQITGLTDQDSNNIRRSFLQNFLFSGQTVQISNNKTVINTVTGFDKTNYSISGYPVFTIELGPNSLSYTGARYFIDPDFDYYRTINVRETDLNKYEIIGLQYFGSKFIEIDSGISFQRNATPNVDKTPTSPTNLYLNLYNATDSSKFVHYSFLVNDYKYVNNYKVYATTGSFGNSVPDNTSLAAILPADVVQGTYKPFFSGIYSFRVYSYNSIDNLYSNSYASGIITINQDLPITDVIVTSLKLIE